MRKLSVGQWIALISSTVGLLIESELFTTTPVIAEVGGKVLIALGLFKLIYDNFMSFQAEDVANFANDNAVGEARKSGLATKQDVKKWAKY